MTGRFDRLPEPVDPADLIAHQETVDAHDPENGKNTDVEFLLRYN
ncbi:hypothetical protein [Nocardioides sp. R-C-SC26]|nr:hypothetical protein [Nocardioides sp. R-C-SC26]